MKFGLYLYVDECSFEEIQWDESVGRRTRILSH